MVAKSLVALAASTVVAAVVLSAAASWGVASIAASPASSQSGLTTPTAGATGASGKRGETGPGGVEGVAGATGTEGVGKSIVGPAGPTGLTGLTGKAGVSAVSVPLTVAFPSAPVAYSGGNPGTAVAIATWTSVPAGNYVYSLSGTTPATTRDTTPTAQSYTTVECAIEIVGLGNMLFRGSDWYAGYPMNPVTTNAELSLVQLTGADQSISIVCTPRSSSGASVTVDYSQVVANLTKIG